MKALRIVTDSHSGITQEEAKKMGIDVLPMPFTIDGKDYEEEVTLSRETFFEKLASGAQVSTSQPSLTSVMELWDRLLEEYEKIIYIPLSSGLSGSCATATALASDEPYAGRVFVVDNGRASTPMLRSVMDAVELQNEGFSAEQIKEMLEASKGDMSIYITVETLEYLKKGGRISAASAAVGTLLNIKPVLRLHTGLLESYQKCRGLKKAKKAMLEAIRNDLETTFKEQYENGEVYMLAASSAVPEVTAEWVEEIEAAFPGMKVMSGDLSLGICCHTGPGALGVGFSCRPRR